jgi:tRNA(Ile)-lysidine synthase
VLNRPLLAREARALFADLATSHSLILAVSGGPDSTALLLLAARWRARLRRGPDLVAVTIDHGLRPEAGAEASAVSRLARRLGVAHRTLAWRGEKPSSGLQEAARAARYRLLAEAAERAGARQILTAHTLDDQAETVLFRLARGSGLSGLAAMSRTAPLPVAGHAGLVLVRPLLGVPKVRLIATCEAAGVQFAADPSNADPRFTRPRLRALLPALADEGLDGGRLARLARRLRRADAALEAAVDAACETASIGPWPEDGPILLDGRDLARLPAEIRLRLLGRALQARAQEGTVELGKLEALLAALDAALAGGLELRRTLAGAQVTLADDRLVIAAAPPRGKPMRSNAGLTTPAGPRRRARKQR